MLRTSPSQRPHRNARPIIVACLSVGLFSISGGLNATPEDQAVAPSYATDLSTEAVSDGTVLDSAVLDNVSFDFQSIAVRAALQLMADVASLNLVVSDQVDGDITLRLDDVPWQQALTLILQAQDLAKRHVGNVLIIEPVETLRERERMAEQQRATVLAPLHTEHIRIRYADAKQLHALLTGKSTSHGSLLSARGRVMLDQRTNALLITETAEQLTTLRHMLTLLDAPVAQVSVAAHIAIVSANNSEQLGIRWAGAALNTVDGNPWVVSGSLPGINTLENNLDPTAPLNFWPAGNGLPLNVNDTLAVDLGITPAAGSLAIGYLGANVMLNLELSALESQGRSEIISQPKIVTGDKQKAVIKSGIEVPYQQSSANGETTVAFKEAVLKLEVVPTIIPDGRVLLDLVISQDSVGELVPSGSGGFIPTINTTELTTQVLVTDGDTVVLGGIFRTIDTNTETKVPWISSIPYIGRLFKKHSVSQEKREILIFITPKILDDITTP